MTEDVDSRIHFMSHTHYFLRHASRPSYVIPAQARIHFLFYHRNYRIMINSSLSSLQAVKNKRSIFGLLTCFLENNVAIHLSSFSWIPAYAGMTEGERVNDEMGEGTGTTKRVLLCDFVFTKHFVLVDCHVFAMIEKKVGVILV
jgi:hypothetical protein